MLRAVSRPVVQVLAAACRAAHSGGNMQRFHRNTIAFAALLALLTSAAMVRAQQVPVDLILSNGKIITVDQRFSIAQAVAIRGERIVAVGSNQEMAQLA